MTSRQLILRSLSYYWRTNLAVVLGVAAAVTVLAGALLVGDSVRGSLRDLVLGRLGRTSLIVVSQDFFRDELAADVAGDPAFQSPLQEVVPLVALEGFATDQSSGRRAGRVRVYGVDDRFWRFHGFDPPSSESSVRSRDLMLSPALAREIGAAEGSAVLLRVQQPSVIPLESLHGRKDDLGRTMRLTVRRILPPDQLGEFSLAAQQGEVRAAFVSLGLLQGELERKGRVNALLVSAAPDSSAIAPLEAVLRRRATLGDLGLTSRVLEPRGELSLESDSAIIDDQRAEAATRTATTLGMTPTPVLTYLVNTMRGPGGEVPYSLVTATDLTEIAPGIESEEPSSPPIVLNEWAARELRATTGDRVTLDYYVWQEGGRLATETAQFQVAGVVSLTGPAADRDLAPSYPGITDSDNVRDWDPPFPIDLTRIRPVDEQYWRDHRTTPKAFVPAHVGRALWKSRYGSQTSVRIAPAAGTPLAEAAQRFAEALRESLDPIAAGLVVRDVRTEGLAASRGATNFGEYFTYFSFFLVLSSIVLAALFFKLGIEQRVREVGLLRAVGLPARSVYRLFGAEGVVLSVAGSAIGVLGALGYASLMMAGLRTWWVDAVGTTALTLHVSPLSLLAGGVGGVVAAAACIWWTLRSLAHISERSLLAGQLASDQPQAASAAPSRLPQPSTIAIALLVIGLALVAAGIGGILASAGAFFGAGGALLGSALFALAAWLARAPRTPLSGSGWRSLSRLGVRNAAYRPSRSVLSIAVMAAATFILISVDAFKIDEHAVSTDVHSGTGGYPLIVETLLPLVHDPNGPEGRELTGLASMPDVSVVPFRLRPGDDASCLNLYAPTQPRVLGVTSSFIDQGRFRFNSSLERADEERANPWLLLRRSEPDGAIPAIADANSMSYVLHRGLGEDIVFEHGGREVRLRLVGALSDSLFQSELLISEENFIRLFPEREGYQSMLVDAPGNRIAEVSEVIEDRLSDFGADATSTGTRLAEFHRVQNTYVSTFQTLGGLGLLLGTVGLAAVLLRNVLERRRELALLGAVGYSPARLLAIVIAESALLLTCGLAAGTFCALVAIAPAAMERGGALPTGAGAGLLLFGVFTTGLVSSIVAARAALQARLLEALRAE
jgi:ABC-type antimicrobial peptide transport system permease subunit